MVAMNVRMIALSVLMLPFILAADDVPKPTIKSPAAIAAVKKYDLTADKAQTDYNHTMQAAEKQLIADLDAVEKNATKSGSLDEALAIRAAKNDAQERLADVQESTGLSDQRLAREITGSDWQWQDGRTIIRYMAGGQLLSDGKPLKWKTLDANSIAQTDGINGEQQVRVTFTADRKACVWQYFAHGKQQSNVATATRITH